MVRGNAYRRHLQFLVMKKILYAFIVLFCVNTYAQEVEFEVNFGTNVLPIPETEFGRSYSLGLHGGASVLYNLKDGMSLRSGLFFTQKEQRFMSFDTSKVNLFGIEDLIPADNINLNQFTAITGQVKQSYIEIPLLFQYEVNSLHVFAGPYVGLMIQSRTRTRTVTEVPFLQTVDIGAVDSTGFLSLLLPPAYSDNTSESSSTSNYSRIDAGIRVGIGFETSTGLGTRLNYSFGVIDYRNDSQSTKQTHSYLQATVFYKLPF
jgi:hypothetical protein